MRSNAGLRPALLLTLIAPLFAQAPDTPPPASIEGEVRNAVTGEPIERAHVVVSGKEQRYGTLTNTEGKFVITGIPAGIYIYSLDRTGFVSTLAGPESQITLQPGDKRENVKFKLTPTGAIIGHVYDADGVPMQGIGVAVESGSQVLRGTSTDDRGQFRIGGLRAGKYRVKAEPHQNPFPPEIRTDGSAEVHYAATYYPAALDRAGSTGVEVRPAVEANGIDIRLVRVPIVRIWGRVSGLPANSANAFVSLQPHGAGARARPDGSFEIWRPNPGKYSIVATAHHSGVEYSSAPLEIAVGQADVENLALVVLPAEDIAGRVEYEDDDARKPGPERRISLRGVISAPIKDNETFTLHTGPGTFPVSIEGGSALYVKSMSLGPTQFDGATLNLQAGSGGAQLTVRVASAKGVVKGIVRDEKGAIAGARVVLAEFAAVRTAVTGPEGAYSFQGIAPGKYKLYAFEEADVPINEINSGDFDDIATKIEVGDRETVVKDLRFVGR
jgi:hypothetical protein